MVAFPYLRVLPEKYDGKWLGMSMPGILYRSDDFRIWEAGAMVFDSDFRHCAPEHILHSTIALVDDWSDWVPSEPESVLAPEESWEGADLAIAPSARGQVTTRVRQLRDPAIVEDGDHLYIAYAVAGECGLALAEIHDR